MIVESPLQASTAVFSEVVPAGEYFLKIVEAGQIFRILDLEGNQAADTLFYNAADVSERYSAMDTIREQGNVYLTAGTELLSNLGNTMLTIVA
ncbi:MAG: urea carboxylase, partial [Pseudomonadales bacterium]|nr:urea carboxylase [Pseudomonadales bacterium]